MPTLDFLEPILEGRASICKYKDRKYFNLRVKRDGKRYTHISLNTDDIEKAKKNAIDAYVKVVSEPPRSSKSTMTLFDEMNGWYIVSPDLIIEGLIVKTFSSKDLLILSF